MIGRNTEAAYLAIKRMREIVKESSSQEEARSRVIAEYPAVDVAILSQMRFYRDKFR